MIKSLSQLRVHNLSSVLSQQFLQNSGLTPGHPRTLTHSDSPLLTSLAGSTFSFTLQSAPFLSWPGPPQQNQLFPCMYSHSSLYPPQLYLRSFQTALVNYLFVSFTGQQTSGPGTSPWTSWRIRSGIYLYKPKTWQGNSIKAQRINECPSHFYSYRFFYK